MEQQPNPTQDEGDLTSN